jgi:hypothetical protein
MSTALAVLAAGHALPVRAETVLINDQLTVRKSDVPRPARGLTMTAVEAKFGAPSSKRAAVGAGHRTPPITRWDYGQFAVFFENDRVIDAIIPPAAGAEAQSTAVAAQAPTNAPEAPSAAAAPSMPQTAPQDSTPSEPIPATPPNEKPSAAPEEPSAPTVPISSAAPSLPAARLPGAPSSAKGGDVLLPVSIPPTAAPTSRKP